MRVVDPGHYYELSNLDAPPRSVWTLRFVKRIGSKYPGNEPPGYGGTTSQEVIRALIDRMKYVDAQIDHTTEVSQDGHRCNADVLRHLREALIWLEVRAADERGDADAALLIRNLVEPEVVVTCDHCGHLFCRRDHAESP